MGTRKHTTPPYPHPASPFMYVFRTCLLGWGEGCTSERAYWNERSSFINQTYPLENSHIPRLEEGFHLQIWLFQKLMLNKILCKNVHNKDPLLVPRKVNLCKTKRHHHQNQSYHPFATEVHRWLQAVQDQVAQHWLAPPAWGIYQLKCWYCWWKKSG